MRPLLILPLVALLLAGCTGGDDAPAATDEGADGTGGASPTPTTAAPVAPAPVQVSVAAVGAFPANPAFDPADVEVPSGASVTVVFANQDTAPFNGHNWVVDGVEGAATDVIDPGQTAEITFTAPAPGEYRVSCTVPGHADRGMVGTLVVK